MPNSKCPVCFNQKNKFKFRSCARLYAATAKNFDVYRCPECHAWFVWPQPDQKEIESYYPANYISYPQAAQPQRFFARLRESIIEQNLGEKRLNVVYRWLAKLARPLFSGVPLCRKENGKFLDIGCGRGENLEVMQHYGWQAYGIEVSPAAVDQARRKGLKVSLSDLENYNPGLKFDCIRIWHVFEHLRDPHRAAAKLADLLNDNGEILMAVPNTHSLPAKLFGSYWYNLDVPRHLVNYSLPTLRCLLDQHQLQVVDHKFCPRGGTLGSLSNFINARFSTKLNLSGRTPLIALFLPFDLLVNALGLGDVLFLKVRRT